MTKESSGQTTAVQVALRIRPLTDRDRAQPRFANLANDDVLKIHENTVQVVPQNKLFTFDHVFGTNSTQDQIFSALGDNLIRKFVEGYNITILAYGQTSSGKTYTMGTAADGGHNTKDEGIVPRSIALLFDLLNNNNEPARPISPTSSVSSSTSASNKSQSRLRPKSRIANRSSHIPQVPNSSAHKTKFTVKVSFIEIYNEDLHDLLNSAPLEELPPITIREDTKGRIYWTGVKEVLVHSTDDVLYYLEQGTQNRATGSTDMNEKSSRSHAIFSVSLKQEKWMPSSNAAQPEKKRPASSMSTRSSITPKTSRLLTAGADQDEGEWLITTSKFHFVDLAGSERLKRTAAEGDRRKEGININAGLLALGNVISALGDPSKKNKIHVPYRDSKLTRLLQDSLGGSATTLMIACASPVEYNLAETLNTLQYANRARNIKNKSEKNQVEEWMTTENIELLRSLIGKLKNELNYVKSNTSPTTLLNKDDDEDNNEEDTYYHDQRMLISDLQRQVEELDGEASVTRERNRIVEKELQRVRLLESMMQNKEEEEVDFQHLVEPVIEEYEKSVSKLESQLALTRAALNHSDMGFEEQQNKLQQLETLIRSQEQTISELRLRLGKVLEREQSNESYIHELETKLMKSANETTKDQEMLNELKNRIMKFKETDESTEQYIYSLEQRLASGDAERSRLRTCVEDLEAKIEAKERTNVELLKRLSKTTSNTSTEKLILKELDEVNAKYFDLEKERDSLQQQITALQKENHRISTSSSVNEANANNSNNNNGNATLEDEIKNKSLSTPPKFKNRKSFADETETPSSVAALSLLQSKSRAKEEAERANRLQLILDRLQYDHQETLKELDEVLQRYHETLEQLDFLERDSSSTTAHEEDVMMMPKSLDLSKEIAQAKEDAHEQEKQAFVKQIANLQQALSKQKAEADSDMSNRIQKLEHELAVANKQVYILKQMESEHNATAEVEHILENLDSPTEKEDNNKLLELEKQQTKHWKIAHSELKQDMEKMTLDLDEKEQYIAQLKQQVDDSTTRQGELQTSLDESNQQSTSLQKRLAETLASLTVLKIAHDGLQKKQATTAASSDTDLAARHKQEKESLLDRHQTELANVQQTMTEMDQVLKNTTLDKETALQTIVALETQLKEQTERIYLEQEKMLQDHDAHVSALTKEFETQSNDLKEKMASLETELEMSKDIHEETLIIHNQRLREATTQHLAAVHELEEQIHSLQSELISYQDSLKEAQSQHVQQMSVLESELNDFKSLHADRLQKLSTEHQSELEAIKSENERLNTSHRSNLREINSQHSETTAQQLNVLQQELSDIKNLHAEQLQKLIAEHSNELDAIKSENQRLAASHQDSLRQVNSQHNQTTAQQLNDLKNLHAEQLQQLNMEHSKALEAAIQYANEKLTSSHQDNLRKVTSQNSETTQQMKALQQELVQAKSLHADQLDKLNLEHYKTLKDVKAEHERVVSSHQDNLRDIDSQLTEKAQSLNVLQEEFEQLKALNMELEAENENFISTQQALQMELKNAKQVEASNQQKIAALESQLAAAKTEEEARQVDLKSTQEQLNILQKERNGPTEKMVSLESELITAKADHVTLTQAHQAQLAEALSQHEQRVLALNEEHSKEIGDIHGKHSESLANLESQHAENTERGQGAVAELTQDLEMLRTTNIEKEETIYNQRQTIEKHLLKINELSEEIAKLQFSASLSKQGDDTTGQQKLYEDRIAQLEQQMKQIGEENVEYTSLAEELEKEIQRMTAEKEALAEDLDLSEESVQAYQQKMNDMKSVLGVMSDEQVAGKIKELLERSNNRMSIVATSETQGDQSSVNNNDTSNEKRHGSGAISQQHGTHTSNTDDNDEEERQRQQALLKKELENCQNQMKDMVTRDKMMSLEKQLDEEKQKLDKSEKTIKKLEKQLEELLKKKSSFMCF